jgi:polyphosphate kinase
VGPAIAEGPESGPEVFIGSADLMHRNLDRRVETLIRISDPTHVGELLGLLDESMADTTASWHLLPDGTWERPSSGSEGNGLRDLQAVLIQRQRRRLEPVR